ncbi:SpaA isopeptide-forming pilin-related protein [Enterococcus sp.]|uniref:SpaA isopeptide-forming pilin-related protein n=1 Tax=Enterococcus sp. TaxID=35783 RepID=UPI0029066138|nr:SpaA isopeptide-forming pilin-related protein [Enterococcus sp.]MDU5336213.1 SpaA isopeptide-forming pilin-related protein [Enterococcus sp.]
MRKTNWITSVLLIMGLLISLIPFDASSRAENLANQSEILVTEAAILDSTGEKITADHLAIEQETLSIELMWKMSHPGLIEEGATYQLELPKELTYKEQTGQLPDGMGSFQVSDGRIQFTFAKNYEMEPDGVVPDYSSAKQYQGSLSVQAEVPMTDTTELSLDFGNQIVQSLFVETKAEETNPTNEGETEKVTLEDTHDLNARNVWVIRSMKVTDEAGKDFTAEKPPMRDDNIQIDFTWALKNEVIIENGDYFTYQLPDYFAVHNALNDQPLKNSITEREPLGTFDLSKEGLLTIKFNENAELLSNREGTVELETQLDVQKHIDEIVTEKQIKEDGSEDGEIKVTIAKADITKKGAVGNDLTIAWDVIINQESRKLLNVIVKDTLEANLEFSNIQCQVPDGEGGWKGADSGFFKVSYGINELNNHYCDISFPTLEKDDKHLTHPVKFIIHSKIIDDGKANAYANSALIQGDNFIENAARTTVDLVDIPSYKFLVDSGSEFEKGIFDWRIKAEIKNNNGIIIDQMYKPLGWEKNALHYLDEESLRVLDANENDITEDKDKWTFVEKEKVTKDGKIVRFGIQFTEAGTYYLSYKTKAFELPWTSDTIPNYLFIEGVEYNGSSGIKDGDSLGIIKESPEPDSVDYMKREIKWRTTINTNKIFMKDAVIEDRYSRLNGGNKCAMHLVEDTLHIYPLKANPENHHDIDETRELKKGKDFILESKGDNYADGFVIKLIGDFAETSETLQLRYSTHFNMEKQSAMSPGKSNFFPNSVIVTYEDDEGNSGYDSDEEEKWVDKQLIQNGWKYGAFVAKGEEYKNQVSPFAGEEPTEDTVYWTVPINSWGVKLKAGTIIKEIIHAGQTDPEVEIHKVSYGRPEYGLTGYGPKLNGDDYEIIPSVDGSESFDIKLLKDITEPFALFVKVKAGAEVFKYKNKVEMDFEGEKLNIEAFVDKSYKGNWLSKSGNQELDDENPLQSSYQIILNKDSRTILKPIIKDTVVRNEQTFQQESGKPKVRAYTAENNSGIYEKVDEINLTEEGRSATITDDWDHGLQTLTISLGESIAEPCIIEYSTNIDPAIKNGTRITNDAELYGSDQMISETVKEIEVKNTTGSGTSTGVDGALKIHKLDEDKQLINSIAEFAIYRVDVEGGVHDFLPSVKVKGDRIVQVGQGPTVDLERIEDLRYGEYAIKETKAPDGYELDDTLHEFTIGDDTPNHEYVYEHINKKTKPFELSILKQNEAEDLVLKGGEFSLYESDPDKPLATAKTGDDGVGKFVDNQENPYVLQLGKTYKVKETKAPEGFVKLKGEFTVSISSKGDVTVKYDGDDLKDADVIVKKSTDDKNSQIQFTARNNPRTPLPKTGGAGGALLITLGLVGLIVGLWYHFPLKKKEGLS